MFLALRTIELALKNLESIHPFYGTSFLVCKFARLPIDAVAPLPINANEKEFLDNFFHPLPNSEYYYRLFRPSDKEKRWVGRDKYARSTLQTIRTRGMFSDAFIHNRYTNQWGWVSNYVSVLKLNLSQNKRPYKNKPVPAFHLAVWLYRDKEWSQDAVPQDVVQTFLDEFFITEQERQEIFDLAIPADTITGIFQPRAVTWSELRSITGTPDDLQPDEGGTLAYLELRGVGPAKRLTFEPAERLNLITGDNGLGKTFLLDCAWWALTGQWANPSLPAYPRKDESQPEIIFQIAGEAGPTEKTSISYDWNSYEENKWPTPAKRPTIPGLLIYARVDGSYAVCDPVGKTQNFGPGQLSMPRSYIFSRDQVWDGYEENISGQKRPRINGLIRDWVSWQNSRDRQPFDTFVKVLNRLSPPAESDLGPLKVGEPVRMLDDTRDIPTLEHPYGIVPIVHAAAGVRRILTLAYLIVWAWNEHKINSKEARKKPQRRIVVLIDELEAHLHPQWQRRILPALLDVKNDLAEESDIEVQSIVATHSPLVMASVEPDFRPEIDKLFHLDMTNSSLFGNEVQINELPFSRRGLIDFWLTSEVFKLRQARSLEAEQAIEEAKALQQLEHPNKQDIERISHRLQLYLSDIDVFWPRWTNFAEKNGVEI